MFCSSTNSVTDGQKHKGQQQPFTQTHAHNFAEALRDGEGEGEGEGEEDGEGEEERKGERTSSRYR
jgi:hypothetical protein